LASGALAPTTTTGIRVSASSTIGDGTATGGLTIFGPATTTATTTTTGLNVLGSTNNGTSTAYIYSKTAGFGGRVILEDSDAAGCTEIYALNGTLTSAIIACPPEI